MTKYQIAAGFHRAAKTIIRAVKLSYPNKYECTLDGDGYIQLPTLLPGDFYVQLAGISDCQISIDDSNEDIRLIGDDGWSDGSITSSMAKASVTSFYMRDLQFLESYNLGTAGRTPTGAAWNNSAVACYLPAETSGPWERGFKIIKGSRDNKDIGRIGSELSTRNNRVYVEILKELGRETSSPTSPLVYDFLAYDCNVLNYSENEGAEALTEVTYELASVGQIYTGKYRSQEPIKFSDDWTYSDFRDETTKESICRFAPEYTAVVANTKPVASVQNVRYFNETGIAWLMMSPLLSHFGVGRLVSLYGIPFGCFSSGFYNSGYFPRPGDPTIFPISEVIDRDVREFMVMQASYADTTGVVTLELDSTDTIKVGSWVSVEGLTFSCNSSGNQLQSKVFPQEASHSMFLVTERTTKTIKFVAATSTIVHTYVRGGMVRVGPVIKVPVGATAIEHFYLGNGGTATIEAPLEADGTLSYNNADLRPRVGSVLAL